MTTPEHSRALHLFVLCMPWFISASTLWMKVQTGNKSRHAWSHGLINQGLWFLWIPISGNWGLLPMTVGLSIIYVRNHFKWRREALLETLGAERDLNRSM